MAEIIVNTVSDVSNPNDGLTTLREAITEANSAGHPGLDTIIFAADVFDPLGPAKVIRLAQGEIEITETIEIDGGGQVIITGDRDGDDTLVKDSFITDVAATVKASEQAATEADDPYDDNTRIFNITDEDARTTLKGLTLTGGRRTVANSTTENGGAVRSLADLVLENVMVSGNSVEATTYANGDGGGLYSGRAITLIDSKITGNMAERHGGGFWSGGAATLTNTVISKNAAEQSGGGIASQGILTLNNSTISGNSATDSGGGISCGAITLNNSTVNGNVSERHAGGIIAGGNAILNNSTIDGNSTNGAGGGFLALGDAILNNSTIKGNSADEMGGGVFAFWALTLTNSTIGGNTSGSAGGGLYVNGTITLTSSTISGNLAEVNGGGLIGRSNSYFTNSIILGNSAPSNPEFFTQFSDARVSSLYTGDPGSVFAKTEKIAEGIYAGILADNGGPTQTIQILAGGLAHDKGAGTDLTTDQRGERRVVGSSVDIGAVELNRAPVVVNDSTSTNSDTSVTSLLLTNDSDIDGDRLTIGKVNGKEAGFGSAIRLASGALLWISENGEFTYDPDGAFDDVPPGMKETDSFEYTATDGEFYATARATIAIAGQARASTPGDPDESAPDTGEQNNTNNKTEDSTGIEDGGNSDQGNTGTKSDATSDIKERELATGQEQTVGTNAPDLITCQDGNNRLSGLKGNDTICGGQGDDIVLGGKGRDHLNGAAGHDLMRGAKGNDLMSGGRGNDTLLGGEGNDKTFGLAGDDELRGGSGNDTVKGGTGDDRLYGGLGHDLLSGGAGHDDLRGGRGNDRLFGDAGDDNFHFEQGRDHVHGGTGNDALFMEGDLDDYEISFGNGEVRVQRGDDMTIAVNIESLYFDDAVHLVDDLRALF